MTGQIVKLHDWQRIIAGEAPPVFYIEIVIRAMVIYFVLITSMRIIGPRMSSQLSRLEVATMVALASAIGVPMLDPGAALTPVVIIAIPVVLISRFIAQRSFYSGRFEHAVHGETTTLVQSGRLMLQGMQKTLTTRERLRSHLRAKGYTHLGAVERVYLEPNGQFTVIRNEHPVPGLCVLPTWDNAFLEVKVKKTEETVCHHCGSRGSGQEDHCTNCGHDEWTQAVLDI